MIESSKTSYNQGLTLQTYQNASPVTNSNNDPQKDDTTDLTHQANTDSRQFEHNIKRQPYSKDALQPSCLTDRSGKGSSNVLSNEIPLEEKLQVKSNERKSEVVSGVQSSASRHVLSNNSKHYFKQAKDATSEAAKKAIENIKNALSTNQDKMDAQKTEESYFELEENDKSKNDTFDVKSNSAVSEEVNELMRKQMLERKDMLLNEYTLNNFKKKDDVPKLNIVESPEMKKIVQKQNMMTEESGKNVDLDNPFIPTKNLDRSANSVWIKQKENNDEADSLGKILDKEMN